MTTQRDLDVAADANRQRNDMRICDKCGWYVLINHADRCDPALGRMAQRLIASVPDVRSGQLGYGDGQVVFDLADDFSVRFEVRRAGTHGRAFSLCDVHRLGSLTVAEAADLGRAIKTWADAVAAKRDSVG
jgi:hypothetical protein